MRGRRPTALIAVLAGALAGGAAVAAGAFSEGTTNSGNSFAAAANFSPVLESVPDVLGAPRGGSALTAVNSDYLASLPPTARSYQWRRCNASGAACADIALATSSTYTVLDTDAGSTIRVRTIDTRGDAPAVTTDSDPTIVAQAGGLSAVPTNSAAPAVDDTTPSPGQTITVSNGTWSGATGGYDYQWYRCNTLGTACAAVGTNVNTYAVTVADQGSRIRARVIAKVLLSSTNNAATTPDSAIVP